MFTRCLAVLIRSAAVTAVIGASALATATYAEACSGSGDDFLATLESRGIDADPATALQLADAVCSGLAEGEAYDALIDQGVADTGLSHQDFAYVVEQSVVFFCPESTQKLPH